MRAKSKKIISLLLAAVLIFSTAYPVFAVAAESVGKFSVTITSDKKEYVTGDEIKLTTNVKNGTARKKYVSVVYRSTPFVKLSDTDKNSIKYDELESGEEATFNLSATAKHSVFTQESLQNIYDIILGKIMSLLYKLISMFSESWTAVSVKVDGVSAVVIAEVHSDDNPIKEDEPVEPDEPVIPSEINITIDQSDFTTNNNTAFISGTYVCNNLDNINYEVAPFFYETGSSVSGEVIIDGSKWETTVKLKPGDNIIDVSVADRNGNEKTKSITVKYDIGESYTYTSDDISVDEEKEVEYINNILVLWFDDDTEESEIEEIVRSIGGTYAGVNYALNEYQIRVSKKSLDELKELADDLCDEYDCILLADVDYITKIENVAVSDPWAGDVSRTDWLDDTVDGSNWSVEAIEAPGAWDYADRFSTIKVGVVDNGFSTSHPDLRGNINVLSDANTVDTETDHGTHVSGIINAKANNGTGLTGIMYNKANLLGYDVATGEDDSISDSAIYNGFAKLVQSGAKVINFSLGMSGYHDSETINSEGNRASLAIAKLLNNGYDFVVVQSAGNSSVDALNNGLFSSITSSNCKTYKNVTVSDIMNRVIIVAAAEQSGTDSYMVTNFSNGGSQVSIAAPGRSIYSTVLNDYESWNGTSMAAPIVTAVAGLVWSVNDDFTGAEVKEIVCNSTNKIAYDNTSTTSTAGDFDLVNAKLAVEEAIKRTDGKGTLSIEFVDAANGNDIFNAAIECTSYTGNNDFRVGTKYTASSNSLRVELPAGNYKFKVSAEGYIDNELSFEIKSGMNTDLIAMLSKELGDSEVQIVMQWGTEENPTDPSDLDSHFYGIRNNGSAYHVYYREMGNSDIAWLDIDDVNYVGPETITLNLNEFSSFTYSVHNFTNRDATSESEEAIELAKSEVFVIVKVGNREVAKFNVPTNRKGTVWNVFEMDNNGVISVINTFEYISEPELVGSTLH